ncbi:hypothetical protein Pelo_4023 [Pelomyxa schiedti]|nr:hypothetical protein Pelo_4023 [Pelomyxa schiedti]
MSLSSPSPSSYQYVVGVDVAEQTVSEVRFLASLPTPSQPASVASNATSSNCGTGEGNVNVEGWRRVAQWQCPTSLCACAPSHNCTAAANGTGGSAAANCSNGGCAAGIVGYYAWGGTGYWDGDQPGNETSALERRRCLCKAECTMNVGAEVVYEFLQEYNNMPLYDCTISEMDVTEQYDYLNSLLLIELATPFSMQLFDSKPKSSTVFLRCCHINSPTSTYVVGFRSVCSNQEETPPFIVAPSGWVVQSCNTGCKLTLITHVYILDPKFSQDIVLKSSLLSRRIFECLYFYLAASKTLPHYSFIRDSVLIEREVYSSLLSTAVESDWQVAYSDHGVEILFTAQGDQPLVAFKGGFRCNASADSVLDFIMTQQAKWDMLSSKIEMVDKFDNIVVFSKQSVSVGPFSSSDSVTFWVTKREPDGVGLIFFKTLADSSPSALQFLPSGAFVYPLGPSCCYLKYVSIVQHSSVPLDIEEFKPFCSILSAVILGMQNIISMPSNTAMITDTSTLHNQVMQNWFSGIQSAINDNNISTALGKRPNTLNLNSPVLLYVVDNNSVSEQMFAQYPSLLNSFRGMPNIPHRLFLFLMRSAPITPPAPKRRFIQNSTPSLNQLDSISAATPRFSERDQINSLAFSGPASKLSSPPVSSPTVTQPSHEQLLFPLPDSQLPLAAPDSLLLSSLSDSLLLRILVYLPLQSLVNISRVCRRLLTLTHDQLIWKNLYSQTFSYMPSYSLVAMACSSVDNTGGTEINQRKLYCISHTTWQNWKAQRCQVTVAQHGHTTTIKCLQYIPQRRMLLTGSSDRKVKVWLSPSGISYACQSTLSGPNAGVVGIDCTGSVIRAGFRNGSVWAWDAHKLDLSWRQQFAPVAEGFLFIFPNVILWEDTVQLWDEHSATLLQNFSAHTKKVTSVKLINSVVISASLDKTLMLHDINSPPSVLSTLKGHSAGINCVEVLDDFTILSAGNDRTLKVWDLRNIGAGALQSLSGHVSPIRCIKPAFGRVLTGSDDHSMRLWETAAGKLNFVQRYEEQVSPVTCMDFDERLLFSGASDGNLKILDFLP